jgi:glycosyltransferase involved in cell wall biosynthesis
VPPAVSFVIPTLGRSSLKRTLDSLKNQTDDDWEAHLVIDDKADDIYVPDWVDWFDRRVIFWRPGISGSAGLLRNEGVKHARGDWVAWVDDDDWLLPHYVELLKEQTAEIDTDVIVFRMKDPRLGTLPPPGAPLERGYVGISYAVKREVMENYSFIAEKIEGDVGNWEHEDITLLQDLQNDGRKILISPFVTYIVRDAI